jgi:hypothetical protein
MAKIGHVTATPSSTWVQLKSMFSKGQIVASPVGQRR